MSDLKNAPDLEELIARNNQGSSLATKIKYHGKYFVVDGTSSAVFSSVMTVTERLSGMKWEEVERSRSIGAATAFLTGYLYNYFLRERVAKSVGINTDSPWVKRKAIDLTTGMASMAPFYAIMLYLADVPPQEMVVPLVTGSALGAAAGLAYGYVADKWRVLWSLQPVLNK